MRVAWVMCFGVMTAFGGCVSRDPYVTSQGETRSGNWRIARQVDRVTGAQLPSAAMIAPASNTYNDYPKPAIMQLTCFDAKPLIRFAFEWKIGSDVNSTIGYRFDDKPGRDNIPGARFSQEERTVVIEDMRDIVQFVNDLKDSRTLYLRIRSIVQGRTTVEYSLDGSDVAVSAAFADCPLQSIVPPVATAARKRMS